MEYQYSGKDQKEDSISLWGEWQLRMSSYEEKDSKEAYQISLPASVTEKGFGTKNEKADLQFLSEKYQYVGKIVLEKTVDLIDIHNKSFIFYMERSRITRVWINGVYAGRRDLLTTEQDYDITGLVREGRNTIEVEVDNTYEAVPKTAILGSHMATEHTQTNWTGIVGRIGLRIAPRIYLSMIRIYPDAAAYHVRAVAEIVSHLAGSERVRITMMQNHLVDTVTESNKTAEGTVADVCKTEGKESAEKEFTVEMGKSRVTVELDLDPKTALWSEFTPVLTSITVRVETSEGIMEKEIPFGLRDYKVSTDHRHIAVNGKNIFIRGEANCAVFPKTGYAPMDEASWDKLFDQYQAYGINYVRCHSWCPPEAAFVSADKKGLFIQPELCEWNFHTFEDVNEYDYYEREAKAIIDRYGNHPSLVALTWGNELMSANRDRMGELCCIMRDYDATRLYAEGSNAWYGQQGISEESDFVMAQGNYSDAWRGAFAGNKGFINDTAPAKNWNYTKELETINKPVISFEVGQFQVYPDYDEIKKYDGPLKPRNLIEYKMLMERNGLKGKDKMFHDASGKLSMLCYREEIEAAMRTPELAGISLLGLQDFTGQGTALVGMIDASGDSKEFANPAKFKAFFSPVTPLVELDKHTFYENETAEFKVYVHNFGSADLQEKVTVCVLNNTNKEKLYVQQWIPKEITQGKLNSIGRFQMKMPKTGSVSELDIEVSVGTYQNHYPVFVYPDEELSPEEENCIVEALDQNVLNRLDRGESLLCSVNSMLNTLSAGIPASYISDFWCWDMFKNMDDSGTMGLCLNSQDPVFQLFPTSTCTDMRWWHLLNDSRAMVLTNTTISPLIQMIDNIQRNEKLAMAFEVRVGRGKLLVTSFNLSNIQEPTVKRFVKSAVAYVRSDVFDPAVSLKPEELISLIHRKRDCSI